MTPRIRIAALLAGSTVALGGCYDFAAPIDSTATHELDPALLGTWRCLPASAGHDETPANFVVSAASERLYSIRFEEKGETRGRYEGYVSEIIGQPVLNVRALEPAFPRKPWTFARYSFLLPDVLRVQLVDDDHLKRVEQTSSSLRTALERLDARPELYVDYCICVRVAAEEPAP